jgi:hypothetical protein
LNGRGGEKGERVGKESGRETYWVDAAPPDPSQHIERQANFEETSSP